MNSQERRTHYMRAAAVVGLVFGVGFVIRMGGSYQQVNEPETASYTTLKGPGYRIQKSTLGENILTIEGDNIFPFQSPTASIIRGRDRLERGCGSVLSFDPGYEAYPVSRGVVRVADSAACFPRV